MSLQSLLAVLSFIDKQLRMDRPCVKELIDCPVLYVQQTLVLYSINYIRGLYT